MAEHTDRLHVLRAFASLRWYEETITFVFPFVAKTSELLLATGIVWFSVIEALPTLFCP